MAVSGSDKLTCEHRDLYEVSTTVCTRRRSPVRAAQHSTAQHTSTFLYLLFLYFYIYYYFIVSYFLWLYFYHLHTYVFICLYLYACIYGYIYPLFHVSSPLLGRCFISRSFGRMCFRCSILAHLSCFWASYHRAEVSTSSGRSTALQYIRSLLLLIIIVITIIFITIIILVSITFTIYSQ